MKLRFFIVLFISFVVGATFWKWRHPTALVRQFSLQEVDINQPRNSIVVMVGERKVTVEDLSWQEAYQTLPVEADKLPLSEAPNKLVSTALKKFILQNIIERDVLIQTVRKDVDFDANSDKRVLACSKDAEQQILDQPIFFQSEKSREKVKKELCERAIINQYFKERIEAMIEITSDEKKAYFRSNRHKFAKNQVINFRQIVLATEDEAKKVRGQLKIENFSDFAKKHSIAPEGERGGRLVKIEKGSLPQVFDFIFSMPLGKMSDIIKTSYGFHIVVVDQKSAAHVPNFSEVDSTIEKVIKQKKSSEAYQSWVNNALNIIAVTSPSSVLSLSAN